MHKYFIQNNLRPEPVCNKTAEFIAGVDQYDSQDFNLNDCGFIRNDLCQLLRAQSQSEYDSLLRKLVELPSSSSLPDDMPIDEAIASIIPRYTQSPSELSMYAEIVAKRDMNTLHDAYEKSLNLKKSSPEPSVVESKTE